MVHQALVVFLYATAAGLIMLIGDCPTIAYAVSNHESNEDRSAEQFG